MLALTVSFAYFIYDTICCAVELPFSVEFLIHHLLTLLGLAFGYLQQIVRPSPTLVSCDFSSSELRKQKFCVMFLTNFDLQSGTELVACLMLMEVSNPFMHGRELLKELNLKESPISLANDVRILT